MKESKHMANCHVRSHMVVTLTVFANSRSASTQAQHSISRVMSSTKWSAYLVTRSVCSSPFFCYIISKYFLDCLPHLNILMFNVLTSSCTALHNADILHTFELHTQFLTSYKAKSDLCIHAGLDRGHKYSWLGLLRNVITSLCVKLVSLY